MERLESVGQPGRMHFSDPQIAQRSTWGGVPDDKMTFASLHTIHQVPKDSTTVTYVNPLDPSDGGWLSHDDADWDTVIPAGRF